MGHPFQWQALTLFKMRRNSVGITCFVQTFSEAINEINILMVFDRKLNKLMLSWTDVNIPWYKPIKLELYNKHNSLYPLCYLFYSSLSHNFTTVVKRKSCPYRVLDS